jgi:hypothetical protein
MKIRVTQYRAFRLAVGLVVGWTLLATAYGPAVRDALGPRLAQVFTRDVVSIATPLIGVVLWAAAIALSFALASKLFRIDAR